MQQLVRILWAMPIAHRTIHRLKILPVHKDTWDVFAPIAFFRRKHFDDMKNMWNTCDVTRSTKITDFFFPSAIKLYAEKNFPDKLGRTENKMQAKRV